MILRRFRDNIPQTNVLFYIIPDCRLGQTFCVLSTTRFGCVRVSGIEGFSGFQRKTHDESLRRHLIGQETHHNHIHCRTPNDLLAEEKDSSFNVDGRATPGGKNLRDRPANAHGEILDKHGSDYSRRSLVRPIHLTTMDGVIASCSCPAPLLPWSCSTNGLFFCGKLREARQPFIE